MPLDRVFGEGVGTADLLGKRRLIEERQATAADQQGKAAGINIARLGSAQPPEESNRPLDQGLQRPVVDIVEPFALPKLNLGETVRR